MKFFNIIIIIIVLTDRLKHWNSKRVDVIDLYPDH